MKSIILIALGVSGLIGGYVFLSRPDAPPSTPVAAEVPDGALVSVTLPENLSEAATVGKALFEGECAVCHGVNAAGRVGVAPPLVHRIYEPGHHGDESFQRAVALGVQAHHWPFGDMPAVEGVTRADVEMIVAYVRELQRANGIQ
ncbi:c-type cytochrome [Jannaschia pohangensis]|uniref:Cytochrome c553 n=1 Tax=Jannaschia pohangensis TaxID=390807 RepID=A0A1I3J338_9RHOB|nr:cytochrome c [Jannaschia pohangensis]SFI54711.1 Cytochrome c553 [Jannaschia pohangensis]